jgi:hypothetical protein
MVPGRGPVKIVAALTIAAAGFGGSLAYKKFKTYLHEKQLRKGREESRQRQAKTAARKRSVTQKRPRTRKRSATKSTV